MQPMDELYADNKIQPCQVAAMSDDGDAHLAELDHIILEKNIRTFFQPIIDLRNNSIFGYEALSRGPESSALHMPELLFETARKHKRLIALERLCRETAIKSFMRLKLDGRLFLNVDPYTLMDPAFQNGATMEILQWEGLSGERVVIELTEHTPVADSMEALKEAVSYCREMGISIALDDLSAGYSNMQLMAELHPEYIKLDKYFIQKLANDHIAREFVSTISRLAKQVNSTIVVEGIETAAVLHEIKKLGLHLGQGYLFGKPTEQPAVSPVMVKPCKQIDSLIIGKGNVASLLARQSPSAAPENTAEAIFNIFQSDVDLLAIPVLEAGHAIGMVLREDLQQSFAQRYGRELHGHCPIQDLMWKDPLIVHANMPINELSGLITNRPNKQLYTPVIVENEYGYFGLVFVHDLLEHITQNRIELAMNANPLTRLPGNIAIEQEIMRLLGTSQSFVLCYIDVDNFKAFNDCYGYKRGDTMLCLLADVIVQIASSEDFVGHIGGDDFIIILELSIDWEKRLDKLMHDFSSQSQSLYDAEDLENGVIQSKGRTGEICEFPLASLSIGAMTCLPGRFSSHLEAAEVASELKCKAKKTIGNCLEIDHRIYSDDLWRPVVQ